MKNLALIGAGNWGKNYLSAASKIPGIKIKYVCTRKKPNLKDFDNLEWIKDYKDIPLKKGLFGVVIATPNSTHFEIASFFLKNNINVLVEKPMVEDRMQARELEIIQNKSKAKLLVGHIYLFDPAYQKAKSLLPKIGKIKYINFEGTNVGLIRKNTSALWDIGSHGVSLCLSSYNEEIESVSAFGINVFYEKSKNYDFSQIRILFKDGVQAFIKTTWMFPIKKRELSIVGSRGAVVYDDQLAKKAMMVREIYKKGDIHSREIKPVVSFPKYSNVSPLEAEIKSFISNKKNISDVSLGHEVTKVLSLAEESIRNNGKEIKYK